MVTPDDVSLEIDGGTDRSEFLKSDRCFESPALVWFSIPSSLGRIETDQADTNAGVVDADADGVSVEDFSDDSAVKRGRATTRACEADERCCGCWKPQMRSMSVPVPSPPPQHIEMRPYRPDVRSSS